VVIAWSISYVLLYLGRARTPPSLKLNCAMGSNRQSALIHVGGVNVKHFSWNSRHWAWRGASAGRCTCAAPMAIAKAQGPCGDACIAVLWRKRHKEKMTARSHLWKA
jgi:hypothetical protein